MYGWIRTWMKESIWISVKPDVFLLEENTHSGSRVSLLFFFNTKELIFRHKLKTSFQPDGSNL